ncbi:MAG TPA: ROK family protein [Puia sp.]
MKKNLYKGEIIKNLFYTSRLSSAELGERVDKSLPLINKMIVELLAEGFLAESGFADSTGGRRPATYSLKPDVLYVIAVAVDQLYTRIAIMDMARRPVGKPERFEMSLKDNAGAHQLLAEKIQEVISRSGIEKRKLAGIGIGMPGFIDVDKGINYSFFTSAGNGIANYISDATGLPVFIDNDSSIIALAEHKFGSAFEKDNAMVINMGWGVGLGLVLKGDLFRGENGFAGEFSHIPLFSNNKLCSCGKSGCLETETSLLVIVNKAIEGSRAGRRSVLEKITLDNPEHAYITIIQAALKGDKFAVELLSEVGYHIGRGVAILIHLLNPTVIILSGRGATAGKLWFAPIQQALNEHCIPRLADSTRLEISTMGEEAEIIGAASLVMENFRSIAFSKGIFSKKIETGINN